MTGRKIRVLVVDDSAIVRKILTTVISAEPDMEVAGSAPDPYIARDKILSLEPDVLTLDIEMPRMDGLTFLKKLMHYRPMPVVVISSLAQKGCQHALEALKLGAVEVMAKPGGPYSVGDLSVSLPDKIRAAAAARLKVATAPEAKPVKRPEPAKTSGRHFAPGSLIAIGASAGGTEAIRVVLEALPGDLPPIVITQHIPAVFSKAFADRLNTTCQMEVKEAADGDEVRAGQALVAPGNFHMILRRVGSGYRVHLDSGPQVCYQRPAVDVMFHSVAETAGAKALGVILTGMGSDGADGMLHMKKAGCHTIGQDEASCLVYGMPKEAAKRGAVETVLPLDRIPGAIVNAMASMELATR